MTAPTPAHRQNPGVGALTRALEDARRQMSANVELLKRAFAESEKNIAASRAVIAERSAAKLRSQLQRNLEAWELIGAVAAALAASGESNDWRTDATITYQHLTLRPHRHEVECAGRVHVLTRTEWQLLAALLASPGEVFTREQLAALAWGPSHIDRSSEVEVYISRLRRKVEIDPRRPRFIQTVRGSGYRLAQRHQSPALDTAANDVAS